MSGVSGCRSELVREEHAPELIANKFAPTFVLIRTAEILPWG